jgi:hypothetical protein
MMCGLGHRLLGACCVLLLLLMTSLPAQAQEEDAETHYLQAIQFFNEGRYQEALQSFDRAKCRQRRSSFATGRRC